MTKVSRLAILIISLIFVGGRASAETFHTRPSCWTEPRIFHTDERFRDLEIERVDGALGSHSVPSPNGAYRFQVVMEESGSNPPWNANLLIYNERPYLLRIRLPDISQRQAVEARWINEKLVFVRVWWGRIAGTDLVIDAEREAILLEDAVYEGSQPFRQFRQCDDPAWGSSERCRCFPGAPDGWWPSGGGRPP